MAISGVILGLAWYDDGDWVDAVLCVNADDDGGGIIVIEPRENPDSGEVRIDREDWEEVKAFIDREFAKLDQQNKE